MAIPLRDKFRGCIVGSQVGSALGAALFGMQWRQIEQQYGVCKDFIGYVSDAGERASGTPSDDDRRRQLIAQAIIDRQDRVTAEDIRRAWIAPESEPLRACLGAEPDGRLFKMADSSIPAVELGRYSDRSGLDYFAAACQPIGLINAGDPDGALADASEAGQMYLVANSKGLVWACPVAVAIAEATKPGASMDDVIQAVVDRSDPRWVTDEAKRALKETAPCQDASSLYEAFDRLYGGVGIPFSNHFANEVVAKALCVARLTGGDAYMAAVIGANAGRGASSIASIAAGISGALGGDAGIPQHMVDQLYVAPGGRTVRAWADALYDAFMARLSRIKQIAADMDIVEQAGDDRG